MEELQKKERKIFQIKHRDLHLIIVIEVPVYNTSSGVFTHTSYS